MPFNISEITSAINSGRGVARPNLFFVRMTPPSALIRSTYPRAAEFFCDAAQLPGLSFNAQPIKVSGYGTSEQRPNDINFSTLNTTFIVDSNGRAFRFFQQWAALINNWSRETVGVMQGTDLSFGEWNYPETYEGTIEVHCLNAVSGQSSEVVVYQLMRAFPIQIGDVSVAWEMNDQIMRLPISFAYNTWNTQNVPATSQTDATPNNGISLLRSENLTLGQASNFANQLT